MKRVSFLSFFLLFSAQLLASPTYHLLVPEEFEVLFVDGKAYTSSWFRKGVERVTMQKPLNEKHQLVLKFEQVFDDGDDFDIIRSKAFMLEFAYPDNIQELALDFAPFKQLKQAETFAKMPKLDVVIRKGQGAGQKLLVRTEYELEQRSWLDSFVEAQTSDGDQSGSGKPDVLKQLKYWWQQADEQTKAAFLDAVNP